MEYITNGSFEQIDSCYGCVSNIGFDVFKWSGCAGWSNPIGSSSDLWCQNGKICTLHPPNIGLGYQNPRTGSNMAGIIINSGIVQNYREYIQNQLMYPLMNGKKYNLSFYISYNNLNCISTQFGVKFYNQKLHDTSKLWLTDVIPDAVNDTTQIRFDTLNWQLVSIPFIANGTEKFVVIGNFQDSLTLSYALPCDTSFWGNLHMAGGYFVIDDVSIKEAKKEAPTFPNVFTPNNDSVNDILKFNLCTKILKILVYNRWGNLMFESGNSTSFWDGRTTSGEECSVGTYFYVVQTEEKTYKGFVQLMR